LLFQTKVDVPPKCGIEKKRPTPRDLADSCPRCHLTHTALGFSLSEYTSKSLILDTVTSIIDSDRRQPWPLPTTSKVRSNKHALIFNCDPSIANCEFSVWTWTTISISAFEKFTTFRYCVAKRREYCETHLHRYRTCQRISYQRRLVQNITLVQTANSQNGTRPIQSFFL
jgi:hypothetical protein